MLEKTSDDAYSPKPEDDLLDTAFPCDLSLAVGAFEFPAATRRVRYEAGWAERRNALQVLDRLATVSKA